MRVACLCTTWLWGCVTVQGRLLQERERSQESIRQQLRINFLCKENVPDAYSANIPLGYL